MGRRHCSLVLVLLITLTSSASAGNEAAPGKAAPVASAAPTISGSVVQGQTLSATNGSWTGPTGSYALQWSRCNSGGGACAAVAGETSATHLLAVADLGSTMRVSVVSTNKNGSSVATSDATAVVSAPTVSVTTTASTTTTATASTTTTAPTTTTTSTTTTTPTYSPSRFVYCFGDPLFNVTGWGGPITSNQWYRQGYAGTIAQRVVYDDSVNVMQSLGCHTIKAEIQPNDLDANGGTANQRAQVITMDSYLASASLPSLGMKQGQTHWYGFALRTNAGYQPTKGTATFGFNWNLLQAFHNSSINGVSGPLANVQIDVDTRGPCDGSTSWATDPPSGWCVLAQPRLEVQVNGGDQNASTWPNEGPTLTVHRWLGPVFQPGHLYRFQYKIHWDAFGSGTLEWWVDGTKYVDVGGLNNMWHSGSTVDSNVYAEFSNYRWRDTTLPATDVYYGGLIRGETQADVIVP